MKKKAKKTPKLRVDRIVKVIERDYKEHRLIAGVLAERGVECAIGPGVSGKCEGVGHCAVGALLIAGGYPLWRVLGGNVREHEPTTAAGRLLRERYGLLSDEVLAIENVNDSVPNDRVPDDAEDGYSIARMRERYRAVVKFVRWLDKRGRRLKAEFPEKGLSSLYVADTEKA